MFGLGIGPLESATGKVPGQTIEEQTRLPQKLQKPERKILGIGEATAQSRSGPLEQLGNPRLSDTEELGNAPQLKIILESQHHYRPIALRQCGNRRQHSASVESLEQRAQWVRLCGQAPAHRILVIRAFQAHRLVRIQLLDETMIL